MVSTPDVHLDTPPATDDRIISLIPALEKLVAGWQASKAILAQASDATQETERLTFHVERRWIEATRRQADLDHLTITQVVNRAFQAFFTEKSTECVHRVYFPQHAPGLDAA